MDVRNPNKVSKWAKGWSSTKTILHQATAPFLLPFCFLLSNKMMTYCGIPRNPCMSVSTVLVIPHHIYQSNKNRKNSPWKINNSDSLMLHRPCVLVLFFEDFSLKCKDNIELDRDGRIKVIPVELEINVKIIYNYLLI